MWYVKLLVLVAGLFLSLFCAAFVFDITAQVPDKQVRIALYLLTGELVLISAATVWQLVESVRGRYRIRIVRHK